MWFIGVEVEQEMSAPPPEKNPGSAPGTPDVFVYFWQPYWYTKTVHQYGIYIQCSTKVRKTFQQTTQKLLATKT